MLKHLLIRNYALIEELDAKFSEGLTVITGETGAGKSILLGALSLILGQRADTLVLRDQNKKCIIEGTFSLKDLPVQDAFNAYDIDYEDLSLFRREITPQGKSRAFINDTPVRLSVMKAITEKLVDIHSQHESLLVGTSSFQFDVVDSFAGQLDKLAEYRSLFDQYGQSCRMLKEMEEEERNSRTDLDYYHFQLDEIKQAAPDPEEYQRNEEAMSVLRNAEEIGLKLGKAIHLLQDAEINIHDQLNEAVSLFRSMEAFGKDYSQLADRLDSVLIETKDIAAEVSSLRDKIVYDPDQARLIEEKLDQIRNLMLKHNASDIEELLDIRDQYQHKIEKTDSLEQKIKARKQLNLQIAEDLEVQAAEISETRARVIPEIEKEVLKLLQDLGMPGARFRIKREPLAAFSKHGKDDIGFLFNANVGGELQDLSKVASGGELSRFMLSIKSIISQKMLLPTIIFDEIDTGISGETSTRVANILQHMSATMQVVAITHLPQIASRGDSHFLVYKTVENGQTNTYLKQLNRNERIDEVAKMLGGEKPSRVMIETAKELIFTKEKQLNN
ncbi:MAG: DNA repair protein RecN [Bacteroidales bacterium]